MGYLFTNGEVKSSRLIVKHVLMTFS